MDHGTLPPGLELARTTPVFDQDSVPGGLLAAHQVAEGVWGRLVVHTGSLSFVFEDTADQPTRLEAGDRMVIPPQQPHHLELQGEATFAVEFHGLAPAS